MAQMFGTDMFKMRVWSQRIICALWPVNSGENIADTQQPRTQAPLSFSSLAVRKRGESLVSFLMCNDVIIKWRKFGRINRLRFAYCSTDYMLNAWCIRQSPPASQIRVVSYLVPWLFLLFWAQYAHAQLFLLSRCHVRKDTRPSPALPYWKQWKAGQGLGTRLFFLLHSLCRNPTFLLLVY